MNAPLLNTLEARTMEFGPLSPEIQNDDVAPENQPWRHWRTARDSHNVAWLLLDKAETSTNVLSREVLEELGQILKQLKSDMPKGLVLRSAKPSNFCVGADITEFSDLKAHKDLVDQLKAAHAVADRLAHLSCPTVAVIHGNCLGGGLELALCCNYRVALPSANLSLPEILLGLHPGLGGTARLTHLINPIEAMKLMLTGRTLTAQRARKQGLVDQVVEERHVMGAIRAAVSRNLPKHKQSVKERLLNSAVVRRQVASKMREQSAAKAPPQHYPAPEALISLWEKYGGNRRKMRKQEQASFAELLVSETSQNLIRVFFVREKMKRLGKVDDVADAQHLHVIGAGAMGADIAVWGALQGLQVTLFDKQPEALAHAVSKARNLCSKKRMTEGETRAVLDRLIPDFKNSGVRQADVVIEAVPENVELKHKVYAEIEPQLKPDALLATNTSSIPLEQLSESLADPSRLVGLHFFNPVAKMQLIEVVSHERAGSVALARARAFAGQINRLPAPVSSAPGFLVNRALTPYLVEAIILLDEGVMAETIDRVATDFGMPMGPVELADQVGLDICVSVADMLRERLPGALPEVPEWLRDKVKKGELGRKTGQGLYTWEDGEARKKADPPAAEAGTLDRLILPMVNTCMACLREGVIADEQLLDGAMIFGTGFAPFRGGPMHYARTRGYTDITETLRKLNEDHGERFRPDHGWTARANGTTTENSSNSSD